MIFGLFLSGCGGGSSDPGIDSNALILVIDPQGNPVPGATVWVPADAAAQEFLSSEPKLFVDPQGNSCANPPGTALFLACTGSDGIAILPCGDNGTFLLNYFLGAQNGTTSAKCGQNGVVAAPLNP